MSSAAPRRGAAGSVGRSDLCPCGSGKKYKRCCATAEMMPNRAASAPPDFVTAQLTTQRAGKDLGQLTEAAKLREAAVQFTRGRGPTPPSAELAGAAVSAASRQHQAADAERERRWGLQLLRARKFAAAVTVLRRAAALDQGNALAHHALGRALLNCSQLSEATVSLRLAITLASDLAEAHHDLSIALAASGENLEAIAVCRRAIDLAPRRSEGYRLLGELLEATGEIDQAAEAWRSAGAFETDAARAGADVAKAAALAGDPRLAEETLRHTIAGTPGKAELHKTLGDLFAKEGRFDEAIAACDRALELDPGYAPAHLTAVSVRKCTAVDHPRLARMLAALRAKNIDEPARLFLHFAAGKFLDDIGEYREAMRHFDMANRIRHRGVRFDRIGLAEVIDRLIARYTPALFGATRGFGLTDEMPIFIVGMPRSGTTLVEQIVSSHPAVAAGEELFFWSNQARSRGVAEATALTPEMARQIAAEYLSLLRRLGPFASRVTDKQPFNFQQLGLVHLVLPEARIIHCRRHPIDTCLSMYFTYFKARVPFVADKDDLAYAYHQYAKIMDHWRSVLPPDRLLEIDYEDLVANREVVTRSLIDFCGLEWHEGCLRPEQNGRAVTTASLWQARQPIFSTSVARWRRYEPWLGELRSLV